MLSGKTIWYLHKSGNKFATALHDEPVAIAVKKGSQTYGTVIARARDRTLSVEDAKTDDAMRKHGLPEAEVDHLWCSRRGSLSALEFFVATHYAMPTTHKATFNRPITKSKDENEWPTAWDWLASEKGANRMGLVGE